MIPGTGLLAAAATAAGGAAGAARSGITADRADPRQFDAEQAPRGEPAGLERNVENDAGVDRSAEPSVGADLILQLTAVPAGVTQGDHRLRGALAAGHSIQNVPGSGDVDEVGNLERRIPFAAGGVHDKTAVGLHRAAAQHVAFA